MRNRFAAALLVSLAVAPMLPLSPRLSHAQPERGPDSERAADAPSHTGAPSPSIEAPTSLDPAIRSTLAPFLIVSIEHIRDDALLDGSEEIPEDLRNDLVGFVPEHVLEKIRWRIDEGGASLQQTIFALRDTRALTADNVILFANTEATESRLLWAHEIYHVMQYDAWGIDGFVERYLTDYEAIEHEANEFVWRWLDTTRAKTKTE